MKRRTGPRYATTGSIINPGTPGLSTQADIYKRYLAKIMTTLQNAARQKIYRERPYLGRCIICDETDTQWFYIEYSTPAVIPLCQSHHKEYSQRRGTVYDQLVRHGIDVLSWEDWKSGMRPQGD